MQESYKSLELFHKHTWQLYFPNLIFVLVLISPWNRSYSNIKKTTTKFYQCAGKSVIYPNTQLTPFMTRENYSHIHGSKRMSIKGIGWILREKQIIHPFSVFGANAPDHSFLAGPIEREQMKEANQPSCVPQCWKWMAGKVSYRSNSRIVLGDFSSRVCVNGTEASVSISQYEMFQ